jgi:hypothetical protein
MLNLLSKEKNSLPAIIRMEGLSGESFQDIFTLLDNKTPPGVRWTVRGNA